jgi:hypothetical protein
LVLENFRVCYLYDSRSKLFVLYARIFLSHISYFIIIIFTSIFYLSPGQGPRKDCSLICCVQVNVQLKLRWMKNLRINRYGSSVATLRSFHFDFTALSSFLFYKSISGQYSLNKVGVAVRISKALRIICRASRLWILINLLCDVGSRLLCGLSNKENFSVFANWPYKLVESHRMVLHVL